MQNGNIDENIENRGFLANLFVNAVENLFQGKILNNAAEGALQGLVIAGMVASVLTVFGYDGMPNYSDKVVAMAGFSTILGAATGFYNQLRNGNNQPVNEINPHND